MNDIDFLHKLLFKHREFVYEFGCGAISIFGLGFIVAFWFVFEIGLVDLAAGKIDIDLIVIILLSLHLMIQFNNMILYLQVYTDLF